MPSPFMGELIGTTIMLLLGDGVVAGVVLKRTKIDGGNAGAGWVIITIGWALAVMVGVFTAIACGSPDAHLNPAITLGMAVITGDFSKLAVYLPAQFLGAFLGAVLVWLFYIPYWKETPGAEAKLSCFCTVPSIPAPLANFFSETIATVVLVLVVFCINSKAVSTTGLPAGMGPYLVGMLIWSIGLSLGPTTAYAINPARDWGPRLAHTILPIAGKGRSNWNYAWVPACGPLLGACLAGFLILGLKLA